MRTRLARLALAASLLGGMAFMTSGTVAHASACPDPDNPCDPVPPSIPPKVGKPSVTFGCGTVTVTVAGKSHTAQVLPCPGPVIF
ncbi:MAG: hypothetical protein QOG03_1666 [Actinomycetota bacterium]|jgi:hypothetical protein|nr:hypothetical protein [Actinomycetota bacterium]